MCSWFDEKFDVAARPTRKYGLQEIMLSKGVASMCPAFFVASRIYGSLRLGLC